MKRRKEEGDITSSGSSINPAGGVCRPLEHMYPGFVVLFRVNFPCPAAEFLTFYANELSCAAHLVDLSGNGLRAFRNLGCSWSPFTFHTAPQLCSVVLSSGSQNKDTCPRKMLPYLSMAHFSSHNNPLLAPWLSGYQCLSNIHKFPYL